MSMSMCCRQIPSCFSRIRCCLNTQTRTKVGGMGKVGALPTKKKVLYETETDANKLCNYLCGGNIYVDGEDPQLLPPEEYPDWLWELRLDRKAPELDELEYDSEEYWKRAVKMTLRERNRLAELQSKQKIKMIR